MRNEKGGVPSDVMGSRRVLPAYGLDGVFGGAEIKLHRERGKKALGTATCELASKLKARRAS